MIFVLHALFFSEQTPIAPQSLQPLAANASSADSLPDYFNHPALKDSVVLLPGLPCYGSDLPTVPAPHGANEDYPYTHKLATNTLAVSIGNGRIPQLLERSAQAQSQ